jgi:hypothetical protein
MQEIVTDLGFATTGATEAGALGDGEEVAAGVTFSALIKIFGVEK